jgi:hypothetical protein
MQAEVVLDHTHPAVSPTGNNTHTLASPISQIEPVPVPIARSTGSKKTMMSARQRPSELNLSDVNTPSLMSPFLSEQYYGKVGGKSLSPFHLTMQRISSCASPLFDHMCLPHDHRLLPSFYVFFTYYAHASWHTHPSTHPETPLLVVCHAAGYDIRRQHEEHDLQQEPKDAQRDPRVSKP